MASNDKFALERGLGPNGAPDQFGIDEQQYTDQNPLAERHVAPEIGAGVLFDATQIRISSRLAQD